MPHLSHILLPLRPLFLSLPRIAAFRSVIHSFWWVFYFIYTEFRTPKTPLVTLWSVIGLLWPAPTGTLPWLSAGSIFEVPILTLLTESTVWVLVGELWLLGFRAAGFHF